MAKKNISKIITSGSLNKKLLLYFENAGRKEYQESPLLTQAEENALFHSVKTPAEGKKWNDYLDKYEKIHQAIDNMAIGYQKIQTDYSTLRAYILLWNSIENAELLANYILHETKDKKERAKIAKKTLASSLISFVFTEKKTDKEGYIELNTENKEHNLKGLLKHIKEELETNIIAFLSLKTATLDFMEETGVNLEVFKERINRYSEGIYEPIIDWNKYRSDKQYFYEGTGLYARLNKIKKVYNSTPNLEELKPDPKLIKKIKERLFYYEK